MEKGQGRRRDVSAGYLPWSKVGVNWGGVTTWSVGARDLFIIATGVECRVGILQLMVVWWVYANDGVVRVGILQICMLFADFSMVGVSCC